jgi:hypothetical protein
MLQAAQQDGAGVCLHPSHKIEEEAKEQGPQ